jgi:hypothetical protein
VIAVASISRDEVDVIDLWIRHYLAEGIGRIYIADASQDGTRDILRQYDEVVLLEDDNQYCLQTEWMNRLSAMAGADGATWVVPADVDEFLYATDGRTIADCLSDCPHPTLNARSFQHFDWSTRCVEPQRLPKVIFQWSSERQLSMGNHTVTGPPGVWDIVDLRELKYRSFEHFVTKVAARNETLDPAAHARGDGAHNIWLAQKGRQELEIEWQKMLQYPTIADPIPSHAQIG